MGQKVCPTGLRIGITENWRSRWFATKDKFGEFVVEDEKIRQFIKRNYYFAGVPKIEIERTREQVTVIIHSARPGLLIGRKGVEVDRLKADLEQLTGRTVDVSVIEVPKPELSAQLVAENVALQLERRISFRRAMKKAVQTAMDFGAEGIKIRCAGRLGGAELARAESYHQGRVPLHTLRAKIDYGFAEANTVYGKLGIKCWICRGETKAAKSGAPAAGSPAGAAR